MTIEEGDLHVWRYTVDEQEYLDEKLLPMLSLQEHERCCRYVNEAEKIRYVCNHRFVRKVLSDYLHTPPSKIEFSLSAMGKPFVNNSNLFFNYSYRTTFGLLAISKQKEVGVDIEKIKNLQDVHTFANFSFSEQEKEIIFNSPPDTFQDTLFTFWTFKEAIIKALGVGLNVDITNIDLSDYLNKEVNTLLYNNAIYTIKQINTLPGYKAAFAMQGEINRFYDYNFTK